MEKVIVVTGDTLELIESAAETLVKDVVKRLTDESKRTHILYNSFPEKEKHPKVWSARLRKNLSSDSNTTFVIYTFHEDVLNLLGHMIYKKELHPGDIKVVIVTENGEVNAKFDENGFLKGFPMGYLSLNLD